MKELIFHSFDWVTSSGCNFILTIIGCFTLFLFAIGFTAFNRARKERDKWDSILFEEHRKLKDIKNLGEVNDG